jgi:hypothetical protein
MMSAQNIIYYNKNSGCFVEFEIEATLPLNCLNESMNAKDAASASIDALMPYILAFGDTIELPNTLLHAFQNGDEDDIDLFLLASYYAHENISLKVTGYAPRLVAGLNAIRRILRYMGTLTLNRIRSCSSISSYFCGFLLV